MNDNSSKILVMASLGLCLVTFALALLRPAYLGNYFYLGALIFLEVMLVALWGFAQRFFPVLIAVFVWAGVDLPLSDIWTSRRWIVLAIAAGGGFVVFVRSRRYRFSGFHTAALLCVVSAMVSAVVSSHPQTSALKALSLFLLFAYAATGARVAVTGREGKFFYGILFGCEVVVWGSSLSYLFFHYPVFGNPNSLGAIMGVVVAPLLLWGMLISQQPSLYRRRALAFLFSVLLLFISYSRAGIVAAVISCAVLCVCLGRYRMLMKGLGLALAAALLVATVFPILATESGSLLQFVYKGHQEKGALASRLSVWDSTISSIRQRPLFGSGFGTVATNYDTMVVRSTGFASGGVSREHGNSYLAILEWVGLLGVIPFVVLVLIVVARSAQVLIWLRRTRDPFSPAVPIALVMIAGLIHAGFEDWLFAVGYYLCVFFWSMAFVMIDLLPETAPRYVWSSPKLVPLPPGNLDLAMPGR